MILSLMGAAAYTLRMEATPDFGLNLIATRDDVQLGQDIRNHTAAFDLFLPDDPSKPNDAIMMWVARPILMGYAEWLRSYGILYEARMSDIAEIHGGGKTPKRCCENTAFTMS